MKFLNTSRSFIIFIIILCVTVLNNCTNKSEQTNNYSDINSILLKHEQSLMKFVEKEKNNPNKEMINDIITNDFGLRDKSKNTTIKNLNIYKEYFEKFYNYYDSVFKSTLLKVDHLLKNKNPKDKNYDEITDVKIRLLIGIDLLKSYNAKMLSIFEKINNISQLGKNCKYDYKQNNVIIFADINCLNSYSSNMRKLEILLDETNIMREKLIAIKSK